MIGLTLAVLVQAGSLGAIPKTQWPDYVVLASYAVAKHNVGAIESTFSEIKEVPFEGEHSVTISAADALKLLSDCAQSDVRQLHGATYSLNYECPARRKLAKGCDSGDLFLMVDNERSSFVIAHQMNFRPKGDLKCLPSVPLPVGFSDPREYFQRSKLVLDAALSGDDSKVTDFALASGQIFVAPTTADHRPPVALTAQNLRYLFTGCAREGQIQVDKSGASTQFRCSNKTLSGLYAVDFDYVGQRLNRVWIQTPESRAKMNATSAERGN